MQVRITMSQEFSQNASHNSGVLGWLLLRKKKQQNRTSQVLARIWRNWDLWALLEFLWKIVWHFFKKLNVTMWSSNPTLRLCPKELKAASPREICTLMFTGQFYISQETRATQVTIHRCIEKQIVAVGMPNRVSSSLQGRNCWPVLPHGWILS